MKHTCDGPRRMVHYETCIRSLMAQVRDLKAQNEELQQLNQELSQAASAPAGNSQCYGEQMTQILSPLAKHDEVVWHYQRDSKQVAASVADHLKMSKQQHGQLL